MWARHLELCLGLWLALSPFLFGHSPEARSLWATDLVCAAAVVAFSLLAHWKRLRWIYLLELVVAAWLIAFGRLFALSFAPAAAQNQILVGLLIAMLAIVPNEASLPPRGWRSGHVGS